MDAKISTATETKQDTDFAKQLQDETIAVRLRRRSLGTVKKLNAEQTERQAAVFSASPEVVSGTKRLFRRGNHKIKSITAVMDGVGRYVQSVTVEYPENAIRLLNRDRLDEFNLRLNQYLDDLANAMAEAEHDYQGEDGILAEAKLLLGDLHDQMDYPETLLGQWSIDWEFPSVQPDERLKVLNPALYEQERQRVQARFEAAIQIQEQAFISQLQEIVAGMVDRLSPQQVQVYKYIGQPYRDLKVRIEEIEAKILDIDDRSNDKLTDELADELTNEAYALQVEQMKLSTRVDFAKASSIELRGNRLTVETEVAGKVERNVTDSDNEYLVEYGCELSRTKQELKTFQATTVTHLTNFFESFKTLNIGSNAELDELVEEAKQTVKGIDVAKLRQTEQDGRDSIRTPLAGIGVRLEELMISKPRRAISLTDE